MGINAAEKKVMQKTASRHGLRIDFPLKRPIEFSATRKTGSSKARAKTRIRCKTNVK